MSDDPRITNYDQHGVRIRWNVGMSDADRQRLRVQLGVTDPADKLTVHLDNRDSTFTPHMPLRPVRFDAEPLDPGDTDTDQYEANSGRLKTFLAVTAIAVAGAIVIVGFAAFAIFWAAGRWWW